MSETPVPVTNPFRTLPALTQMPIGKSAGSGSSVQYGISSMPVSKCPVQLSLDLVFVVRASLVVFPSFPFLNVFLQFIFP